MKNEEKLLLGAALFFALWSHLEIRMPGLQSPKEKPPPPKGGGGSFGGAGASGSWTTSGGGVAALLALSVMVATDRPRKRARRR